MSFSDLDDQKIDRFVAVMIKIAIALAIVIVVLFVDLVFFPDPIQPPDIKTKEKQEKPQPKMRKRHPEAMYDKEMLS